MLRLPCFEAPHKAQTPGPWQQARGQVLTHLVQVFESQHDLARVHAHLGLLEVLALVEVGEHLPAVHVVWGNGVEVGEQCPLREAAPHTHTHTHLPPWSPRDGRPRPLPRMRCSLASVWKA